MTITRKIMRSGAWQVVTGTPTPVTSVTVDALPPGGVVAVRKDPVTGFWPAAWPGGTPSYSGGSASSGVRPTARADIVVMWIGPDPSPAIVSSGTGGMRDDARDLRFKQ